MTEVTHKTADVFGVSRDLPITYVERDDVDDKLLDKDIVFRTYLKIA